LLILYSDQKKDKNQTFVKIHSLKKAGHWRLRIVILDTWEAEIKEDCHLRPVWANSF
jgi:hypothetical protein